MTTIAKRSPAPRIAQIINRAHALGKRVKAVPYANRSRYEATDSFFQSMPLDKPCYMILHDIQCPSSVPGQEVRQGMMVYERRAGEEPVLEVTRTGPTQYHVSNFNNGVEEDISLYDLVFLCCLLASNGGEK